VFPIPGAVANFLLLRLEGSGFDSASSFNSTKVENAMLRKGIAVRDCANFAGLSTNGGCRYLRVAIRTEAENERLVSALGQVLGQFLDQLAGARG
jgi:histidinol-phosphate/aromatic aminotransferase/cobyric acid decarboxylase-like protein